MKRTLALIFALLMIMSAIALVPVSADDTSDAAEWLSDRLGAKLTDSIVLGADPDEYGVDISALEDDGYIIRKIDGVICFFYRTSEGLDRAVRKYAKTVEAGEAIGDVEYHNGYRIKRWTIAGRDISEYTIYFEENWIASARSAANELAARIEEACGVVLEVSNGEPISPYIELRYSNNWGLGNVGHKWYVKNDGDLVIECSNRYEPTSAQIAVRRFLEKEVGWVGLSYGNPDLECADHVDIPSFCEYQETTDFSFFRIYGDSMDRTDRLTNDLPSNSYLNVSIHGLQNNRFGTENLGIDYVYDQPCYLNEEFFEDSLSDIMLYIQFCLDCGQRVGKEISMVDIGQPDNTNWCNCQYCLQMYEEEDSRAAAVLTWANRLSEVLDEDYPGVYYGIMAYNGTNKLPKTVRPNEFLYITYCYDKNCAIHALDGSKCSSGEPVWNDASDRGNVTMSANLLEWLATTPNVYVWYYAMDEGLSSPSYVHNIRDDLRFLANSGVKGVFIEAEDTGFSTGKVAKWLAAELLWDTDMSDLEYDEFYGRVLRALYGDASVLVKQYIDVESSIYAGSDCATCWNWGYGIDPTVSGELWKQNYDRLFEIIEEAIALADSKTIEARLVKLSCECIYKGSLGSYFDAYNAGDDARVAELCQRYSLIDERLSKLGIDMTKPGEIDLPFGSDPAADGMYENDLEVEAWKGAWTTYWYWTGKRPTRSMPQRVADILGVTPETEYTSGDWYYTLDDNGDARITYHTGDATELVIPAELDGHTVTAIGDHALANCRSLTDVTIGIDVGSIEDGAFHVCKALENVNYDGNPDKWAKLSIGDGNEPLIVARLAFGVVSGDLDGDGSVNAQDVLALLRLLVGWTDDGIIPENADFNGDERVNARDIYDMMLAIANGEV